MTDFFIDPKLWGLATNSPSLQQDIVKAMSIATGYYSIPNGDISTAVFEKEDSPRKDALIDAIKTVRDLPVSYIAQMLEVVRHDIILKEVQGEPVEEYEKTLRDIDIVALAVFTLIKYVTSTGKGALNEN